MSDTTANLDLPYILPSQAQKHVTHNEALQLLDAIVQLVVSSQAASPPPDPEEGDCHAVIATATGDWTGQEGALAAYIDGDWIFIAPKPGWRAWFVPEGAQRYWTGTEWSALPSPSAFERLGIHATADETNRLAVSADASLFNHAGAGHQLKLNKASVADTVSLLFQTGWSGRTEMGLSGSDAFQLKTSSDGSSWTTALTISPEGAVLLPTRPLVRASYGETAMTPPDGTMSGFGTLHFNQGGFALGSTVPSGSGNRLIVPVTGPYLLTVNLSCTAAASHSVSLLKDGSVTILTIRDFDSGSASYSQSATAIAWLEAGSWLALQHHGGAEIQFGYGKTELNAALL
jgi:hypothetical protein